MSALNFLFDKDDVHVFTDSMSSYGGIGEPRSFVTKAFPVPHLDGLICGTGLHDFLVEWSLIANTKALARDIAHLDEFAPEALRTIWAKYSAVPNCSTGFTATVYHFGYDSEEERFRLFVYQSTVDFTSKELNYGGGVKPVSLDAKIPNPITLPDDMVHLIERQKAEDDARPPHERVGIGGEVHWFHMVPGKLLIQVCHRFPDYEEVYERMFQQLPD